jgi:hypothetical protein
VKLVLVFIFFISHLVPMTFASDKKCTFIKHQYVEIIGEKVPEDLKNKILNNLIDDKVYLIKENLVLNARICTSLHALKKVKDFPTGSAKSGEEQLLVRVHLNEDKNFWKMNILSFVQINSKAPVQVSASSDFISVKTIKEIKDIEVVDWVIGKLVQPISR